MRLQERIEPLESALKGMENHLDGALPLHYRYYEFVARERLETYKNHGSHDFYQNWFNDLRVIAKARKITQ